MTHAHPVTAFIAVGTLTAVAISSANPLIMGLVVAALILLSWLAGGPRRACFADAALTAMAVVVLWLLLALVIDQPDTGGTVVLTLPRKQLGAGVAFGSTKTFTWLEQMGLRGVSAGLVVLGLGLLAQLRPARTWLSTMSMLFGRWTDLVAPLICLPEALLFTRRLDAPARRLAQSARAAREHLSPEQLVNAFAGAEQLAAAWRDDHPCGRRGMAGLMGWLRGGMEMLGGWLIVAVPLVMLVGGTWLPIALALALIVWGIASYTLHAHSQRSAWFSGADLPLLGACLLLGGAWALRNMTGDAAALGVAPGGWPGLPLVVSVAMTLVVLAAVVGDVRGRTGFTEMSHAR
ncbi:hypothetical protein [Propionibacterium freudenreichii]|uniref:hypothetical protein n=1 Tax=Propionibacterium freudenreichii TaxID=1744 RepID=UPI0021A485D2|nr:hypothetical protein [Propionibacterium freudenreichii]MDK9663587.1 hypothetical protein [Propionibacterium freudenreichii]